MSEPKSETHHSTPFEMPLRNWSPNRIKFAPFLAVSEEKGSWMKGHLLADPECKYELSFEAWNRIPKQCRIHPESPITYFAIWRNGETIFEFQVGHTTTQPPADVLVYIAQIVQRSIGYRPFYVGSPA